MFAFMIKFFFKYAVEVKSRQHFRDKIIDKNFVVKEQQKKIYLCTPYRLVQGMEKLKTETILL